MSKIEAFKNAPPDELKPRRERNRIGQNGRPSESLVGAVLVRHGREQTTYTYNDGRSCQHPDGEYHDCAYVSARNRLIPAADIEAARRMNGKDDPNGMRRARVFCDVMTELARDRGLIK